VQPGQHGNIVLTGHHNIDGKVFRGLVNLKVGDEITLRTADGRTWAYTVSDSIIVPEKYASEEQRRQNAHYIEQTADDRLTLVTCWPANNNTHRQIIIARPVSG
jgi:sortase A